MTDLEQRLCGPCIGGPCAGQWRSHESHTFVCALLPSPAIAAQEPALYIQHERGWRQRMFSLPWQPWARYTYDEHVPMHELQQTLYEAHRFRVPCSRATVIAWVHESLNADDPEVAHEVAVRYAMKFGGPRT